MLARRSRHTPPRRIALLSSLLLHSVFPPTMRGNGRAVLASLRRKRRRRGIPQRSDTVSSRSWLRCLIAIRRPLSRLVPASAQASLSASQIGTDGPAPIAAPWTIGVAVFDQSDRLLPLRKSPSFHSPARRCRDWLRRLQPSYPSPAARHFLLRNQAHASPLNAFSNEGPNGKKIREKGRGRLSTLRRDHAAQPRRRRLRRPA